jgi:hypothetical protein
MYDGEGDEPEVVDSPKEESKEQEAGEDTALLPKSLFSGKDIEPGSKCEVEIVHIYEDEVEVKYVKHNKESKGEAPKEEPSMKDKIQMAADRQAT